MKLRFRVAARCFAFGLAAALAACGGMSGPPSDASVDGAIGDAGNTPCTGACCDAEHGPPAYGRESLGHSSASSTAAQMQALVRANHWRTSAGLNPLNASAAIEQAAGAHATFMATTSQASCWPGTHNEIAGCNGFTGADPGARMRAAGYAWNRYSEVINWEGDPAAAVDGWIWTVYHRLPYMDYRLADTGFASVASGSGGRSLQNNVMDFGATSTSTVSAPAIPVVFPVPGQTDVPISFRGDLEGPTPPGPGGGAWPSGVSSGTVVSVHFPSATWTITDHHLFYAASGECNEVPHTYVSPDTDPHLGGGNDVFLYADQPLLGGTDYVVQVVGTFHGAAYQRTWLFTTH